jgi:TfoX/Sxy family transcriptional regulator of competence genes
MVASDGFAEFLKEQFAPLGRVTMRRMFGKTGVFCNGLMFGMVTDDTLYFRVDDLNRAVFKEAESFPPLNYGSRAAPSTSPSGARRIACSTNPKSLSSGRERPWRRRAGSRRSEGKQRQSEIKAAHGGIRSGLTGPSASTRC